MAVKTVSEFGRAREMFKYAASQVIDAKYQTRDALVDSSSLRAARDTVLTSIAELIALRLGAPRATISLFDENWQYVVAEATPRLSLAPGAKSADGEKLLLRGTAIPRSQSICSHVVTRNDPEASRVQGGQERDLPLFIIDDLSPRLENNPFFKDWPHSFYAGVPIQSPRGIDIGVLSIYGDHPGAELDAISQSIMQDASRTIMEYLIATRSRVGHRRADRMVRGVGSFVEGQASLSGRQLGIGDMTSDITMKAETNRIQPLLPGGRSMAAPTETEEDPEMTYTKHAFSKAANILRESMEIEGVLFLDAAISTFGGSVRRENGRHGSSSSSDDSPGPTANKDPEIPCCTLGFSNSADSSIDGSLKSEGHVSVSEKLLGKFIKRYPKGHIFNYDENGTLSMSDSASEDSAGQELQSPVDQGDESQRGKFKRGSSFKKDSPMSSIPQIFPGARSVAFIPVWDSHKQRWFSGGFIYTKSTSRTFTTEGELSYFSAFSSIVMAEVHRGRESNINRSKTDLLESLSHELRSPLHGIVLGAELLQDTELDIFQTDVLNSIESCCRTLVGTIDHLLDWTKINKFRRDSAVEKQNSRGPRRRGTSEGAQMSIETGMMTTTSEVDIAAITEQVVESLFAGHTFQVMSVMRMTEDLAATNPVSDSMHSLDGMEALESMTSRHGKGSGLQIAFGGVVVTLSIDPHLPWVFATQPGALRRILMNLLGNSLRFTKQGFVEIRLRQEYMRSPRTTSRFVTITVSDSGRGIGAEFLQHQLFKPFAQEDTLGTGAGLGLSLVKNIVTSLRGSISAESKVGEGSVMTVKLPLKPVSPLDKETPHDEAQADFHAEIAELQGLRVGVIGYPSSSDESLTGTIKEGLQRERSTLMDVCTNWLRMRVVEPHQVTELIPDLILRGDRAFEQSFKELRVDKMTPTVIICRNALIARQMAQDPKYSIRAGNGVTDFISQPVGPRKLAKVLLQCFKRWTTLQETAMSTQAPSEYPQSDVVAPSPMEEPQDLLFAQSTRSAPEQPPSSGTSPRPRSATAPSAPERHPSEETITTAEDPATPGHDQQPDTPRASRDAAMPTPGKQAVEQVRKSQSMEIRLKKKAQMARFLLVDDNAINLKILVAYMRKLGHRYDTACNGLEALEAFQKGGGQYRCILMDISMPVMDGFESSRRIRAHEREHSLSRCNIYALTGLASASAQQEAFSSGIDLCLAKPVKLKELSDILAEKN
ncbi:hypothetical protein LQW54_004479 [Pestalotiopsis sp. IQ-011]